jgi:hypothetical protein
VVAGAASVADLSGPAGRAASLAGRAGTTGGIGSATCGIGLLVGLFALAGVVGSVAGPTGRAGSSAATRGVNVSLAAMSGTDPMAAAADGRGSAWRSAPLPRLGIAAKGGCSGLGSGGRGTPTGAEGSGRAPVGGMSRPPLLVAARVGDPSGEAASAGGWDGACSRSSDAGAAAGDEPATAPLLRDCGSAASENCGAGALSWPLAAVSWSASPEEAADEAACLGALASLGCLPHQSTAAPAPSVSTSNPHSSNARGRTATLPPPFRSVSGLASAGTE